jgi:ABC-type transporter Mla subunit MlaD
MDTSREAIEYVGRRVDDLQTSNTALQKANEALADRVKEIEGYFKVIKLVAGALGISGLVIAGFLWQAITIANGAVSTANTAQSKADQTLEKVSSTAATAVKDELRAQMPMALDTRFDELASRLEIAFGESKFLDYLPNRNGNEQDCPSKQLASGMIFGSTNRDYGLKCLPIALARRKD